MCFTIVKIDSVKSFLIQIAHSHQLDWVFFHFYPNFNRIFCTVSKHTVCLPMLVCVVAVCTFYFVSLGACSYKSMFCKHIRVNWVNSDDQLNLHSDLVCFMF